MGTELLHEDRRVDLTRVMVILRNWTAKTTKMKKWYLELRSSQQRNLVLDHEDKLQSVNVCMIYKLCTLWGFVFLLEIFS
jgi:hypothetical protein